MRNVVKQRGQKEGENKESLQRAITRS